MTAALSRRGFLALAAAGLSGGAVGATAFESPPTWGPIETAWRDFRAREAYLNGSDGPEEITDEDARWALRPIEHVAKMLPDTEREWAAFTLVAMFFRGHGHAHVERDIADMIGAKMGGDIEAHAALL